MAQLGSEIRDWKMNDVRNWESGRDTALHQVCHCENGGVFFDMVYKKMDSVGFQR